MDPSVAGVGARLRTADATLPRFFTTALISPDDCTSLL